MLCVCIPHSTLASIKQTASSKLERQWCSQCDPKPCLPTLSICFFSRNVIARNAAAAKTAPMLENSMWQSRFSRNEKPISHTSSQADFGNCCCQCKDCVQFPSAANEEAHPSWRSTNDCAAGLLRFSFFVEFWGQMLLKWSKIFFACGGLLGFYCFSPK